MLIAKPEMNNTNPSRNLMSRNHVVGYPVVRYKTCMPMRYPFIMLKMKPAKATRRDILLVEFLGIRRGKRIVR